VTPDTRDYVGRCPKCGGIQSAMSYRAVGGPKRVGEFHANVLTEGLIFDRATLNEIRAEGFQHAEGCELKPRRETQKAMF
jgi:hypothetical protein